jgi:hypothetical protein
MSWAPALFGDRYLETMRAKLFPVVPPHPNAERLGVSTEFVIMSATPPEV